MRSVIVSKECTADIIQWFQGIHHTISIQLKGSYTSRDIRNIYQERYEGEPLVKVVGESPLVKKIAGTHGKYSRRPYPSQLHHLYIGRHVERH